MDNNMNTQKLSFEQFEQASYCEMVKDPESILSLMDLMWSIPLKKLSSQYDEEERMERRSNPKIRIYHEVINKNLRIPQNYQAFLELSFGEIIIVLAEDIRQISPDDTYDMRDILSKIGMLFQNLFSFDFEEEEWI